MGVKLKTSTYVCHYDQAFSNLVFFWALLWVNQGIYLPSGLLSILAIRFLCYLSIQIFCYEFYVSIFCSKIDLFPLYSVVGMSLHLPHYLLVEFSFVILKCPVLSLLFDSLSISFLFSFFYWYLLIYLFELYRCSNYGTLLLTSRHILDFLLLLIWRVVEVFLSVFPLCFPIQVLNVCICFLGEPRFFLWVISLLQRLVRLIPWCCSLRCVLMIRLFFPFLPWLFFSLDSWVMVVWFSFQT